jgi:hypothetical protein
LFGIKHTRVVQKEEFHEHLLRATTCSFECAKRFVSNELPESLCYLVHLNASYDGNPLEPGEHTFPDDAEKYGSCVGPLSAKQVVDLLWRDGGVPEWVDVSVERTDGVRTFVQLLCCGRFTDREEHLYYSKTDVCPFGCKSPDMPLDWKEGDPPFDLHWRNDGQT